jgi:hypothetical protein
MIWQVARERNAVFALGRDYSWPRPQGCLDAAHSPGAHHTLVAAPAGVPA